MEIIADDRHQRIDLDCEIKRHLSAPRSPRLVDSRFDRYRDRRWRRRVGGRLAK
jgi:hypothetical protein